MKLPFASQQNNLSSSSPDVVKQQIIVGVAGGGGAGGRFEPKSVLDICRSPPANNKTSEFDSVDPLPLDSYEHGIVNQFEEWDSLMNELGLHEDDSAKSSSSFLSELPDLPPAKVTAPAPPTMSLFLHSDFENPNPNPNPNPLDFMIDNNNNGSYDFVDELIRIAECFETRSLQLAQVILARLDQRLTAPTGKPLQRAAFYFKESLQQLVITGSTRPTQSSSSSEIVQAIKAYKTFSAVSPIPMFSSFTANQAILEAVVDGAMIVHVIDFDIGIGGHWASFMKEIAEKSENRKVRSPAFRISAVVPEEYVTESRLIRDNLFQFAIDLNLQFEIDFVSIETFEQLSFKSMKFIDGEKTAVLLTPAIFRRIGCDFVNDLRQISPDVIVHVDGEGLMSGGTSFFRQTVIEGLEFYSTVLESLEAANVGVGGGGDWLRKIEVFVLLPKIMAAVGAAGRRATPWREAFGRAGIRPVGQSQFADFQAECLLRRIQVRGFHVAKRHGEMVLCWHDRPLVATSAWRF